MTRLIVEFDWQRVGRVTLDRAGALVFPMLAREPGLYRFWIEGRDERPQRRAAPVHDHAAAQPRRPVADLVPVERRCRRDPGLPRQGGRRPVRLMIPRR